MFSIQSFCQNKMDIKLISIEKKQSEYKTHNIYSVKIELRNNTNEELRFFFNGDYISNINKSSLSNAISYQVYKEEDALRHFYFSRKDYESNVFEKSNATIDYSKKIDSLINIYKSKGGKRDDKAWILKKYNLERIICNLKPNEIKNLKFDLYWNKIRMTSDEDSNEMYLDEKSKYFIDVHLVLIKNHYKNYFEPEEFAEIENNPNFIEGYFKSNKLELDLN